MTIQLYSKTVLIWIDGLNIRMISATATLTNVMDAA